MLNFCLKITKIIIIKNKKYCATATITTTSIITKTFQLKKLDPAKIYAIFKHTL